jgi:excisionase family DNA binding protein
VTMDGRVPKSVAFRDALEKAKQRKQGSVPTGTTMLTIPEACAKLRVSRWSLYRLIKEEQIESVKIGRRRLIPADALAAFVKKIREEGKSGVST